MTDQPPSYPPPPPPPPPPGGYGYPPPPQPGGYGYQPPSGYPQQSPGTNGMAIASLVCSLLGWLCVGIGSILGVVFGFVALNQIKQTGQGGRGMAIAGIIISAVIIVVEIVLVFVGAIFGSTDKDIRHTDSGSAAVVLIFDQQVDQQPVWPALAA